jgi:hypothetical protein
MPGQVPVLFTSVQVPSAVAPLAALHAWQPSAAPLHAVSQHTPSTQLRLAQLPEPEHGLPCGAPVKNTTRFDAAPFTETQAQ